MIQPNELRKGVLFHPEKRNEKDERAGVDISRCWKVLGIGVYGDCTVEKESGYPLTWPPEEMYPIELTPSWLDRAGARRTLVHGHIQRYYIPIAQTAGYMLTLNFGEQKLLPNNLDSVGIGPGPLFSGAFYSLPNIKHVHQLQNLYFSLSGKELRFLS